MSITRVHYRERQRLTAADLVAEQEYRLAAAGRHHLGPHDWGVVRGLNVTGTSATEIAVWPGVAIDGYGREIVVRERVVLAVDGVDRLRHLALWVYYCDRPEQVPPGRHCEDDPAPRASQRYVLRVMPYDAMTEREPIALVDARAGGQRGWPPWPVLLARLGKAAKVVADTASTRYVRHRAAGVTAPSGRAELQLGLGSREDLYHFLLSTRGSAATLDPRVGVDRGGDIHVWRHLVLTGAKAAGQAVLGQSIVKLESRMVSGLDASIRFEGTFDASARRIEGAFLRLGAGQPVVGQTLVAAGLRARRQRFSAGPSDTFIALARLPLRTRIRRTTTGRRSEAGAASTEPQIANTALSVSLAPFGGVLKIEAASPLPAQMDSRACGDIGRLRRDGDPTGPVVQFRPGQALEPDPLVREIHAAIVSRPDELVPRTTIRLSGGGHDASDDSSRIAIGRFDGAWTPVLQVSGAGGARLLGHNSALSVTGALHLPAIGRSDPLLPDLLALAFMSALPKVPTLTVTITVDAPADATQITRGDVFGYTVKISSNATVKRTFEAIVGIEGPADLSFRRIANPTVAGKKITGASTRHRANKVALRVVCLLQVSGASRMVVGETTLTLVD